MTPEQLQILLRALATAPWAIPAGIGIFMLGKALLRVVDARLAGQPAAVASDAAQSSQVIRDNTAAIERLADVLERFAAEHKEATHDMFELIRGLRDYMLRNEKDVGELRALIEHLPSQLAVQFRDIVDPLARQIAAMK